MNHKNKPATPLRSLHWLVAVAAAMLLAACASMGRPEGGARDVDPPVFVKGNPSPNALNVDRQKVQIDFNENVTVSDVMTKVVVSPAQKNTPSVSANAHRVTVELRDTLLPNTTYTIDFADAIADLNEGNPIDGFSYAFSTGDVIDTLQISGMVFEAATLEPAQSMLVGVYSNLSDTAITTLPLERITRTNQLGEFTIRNLKPGTYRIYAINDVNRDYHWDRTEDVAFYDVTITPTSQPIMATDTLVTEAGNDTIITHPATLYLPNDVLLTWFNENYASQYLMKHERTDLKRLTLQFGAQADTLPELTMLNGLHAGEPIDKWAVLNGSPTRDTLEYWLCDTMLFHQDTIMLQARYLRTDTLDQLSWTTDTLRLLLRSSAKKKQEEPKKDTKKKKKGHGDEEEDSLQAPKIVFFSFKPRSGSTVDLDQSLIFEAQEPIASVDASAVSLAKMVDSVWTPLPAPELYFPQPTRPMQMRIDYLWEPATQYQLTIDSAAIRGLYGDWTNKLEYKFTTKAEEDYSTLVFNVKGLDSIPAVVELLNASDAPIKRAKVVDGQARIQYINPGTYYARLYLDRNDNGKWDTGSLLDSIQPEEVFYFPKKVTLKKYWTSEQQWDLYATPIDQQKPLDIKKNKPKLKPGEQPLPDEEDEDENDFYNPSFESTARRSQMNRY